MSDYGERLGDNGVRFIRLLPGPIERVWAYLTEGDKRAKWLAGGSTELKPGGAVALTFHNASLSDLPDDPPPPKYADMPDVVSYRGKVVECDPPRLLVHTWADDEGVTQVRYELEPQGEQVRLTLTHTRLTDLTGVAGGWHTHLDILADVLSGRQARPFWRTHTALEAQYAERML